MNIERPALSNSVPQPVAIIKETRAPVFAFDAVVKTIPSIARLFAPEKAGATDIGVEHEIETKYHIRYIPKNIIEQAVDIKDMTQAYARLQRKEGEKDTKARLRLFADHGKHVKLQPTYRLLRKKSVASKKGAKNTPEWISAVWKNFFPQKQFPTTGDIELYTDMHTKTEAEQFNAIMSGQWVAKTRLYITHTSTTYPSRTCMVHLDVCRAIGNMPVQYIIAEVEYNTADDQQFFTQHPDQLPDWLGDQVAQDDVSQYKSSYISEHAKTPTQDINNIEGAAELYERLNSEPFLEQAFGVGSKLQTANPF